jgi:hypothetical protein
VNTLTRDALAAFLMVAKAETYAADDERRVRRLEDGGSEAGFARGELAYRDRWYGEARFAGQELVFHRGLPAWAMSFIGATSPEAPPDFPHFHKRALRGAPAEAPFRGPPIYQEPSREGSLVYVNEWTGDLTWFRGVERVFSDGREVYRLEYHGGWLEPGAN